MNKKSFFIASVFLSISIYFYSSSSLMANCENSGGYMCKIDWDTLDCPEYGLSCLVLYPNKDVE